MLRRLLISCIIFSYLTTSLLAEQPVSPSGSKTTYFVDPALPMYQMSDLQKEMISQLKLFDRTYQRWANENISVPDIWHYLAMEVFGSYVSMSCEGDTQSDAPFILRGMLASGVCSLYEAQSLMEKGSGSKHQALVAYERGLEVLEKVIQIGKMNPSIAYLPDYSTALRTSAKRDMFYMHPLAGCETILTGMWGFPMQTPFTRTLITNVSLQTMHTAPFVSLEGYQVRLRGWYEKCLSEEMFKDELKSQFKQGSTIDTARYFLSDFCPWGLGTYRTLKEAGLTKGLDWRILRPFAGDQPQVISELVIKPPLIPNHIVNDLNRVIGDGKTGFLDADQKKKINWKWISRPPTYTIKYVSPMVYERKRTDEKLSDAMDIVKFTFGGPLDFAVDKTLSGLLDAVGYFYGKDNDIYHVSWVLFHSNDKGLLTTGFVTKRELPSITLLLKKTAGAAFAALEQKMVEDMYEGIDPRSVTIGKGYNGQPVPPVMIRGDVLGFQQVPDVEYSRTIQAVRHYLLQPSAITSKSHTLPYDLSKNEGMGMERKDLYLKEQQTGDPKKKEMARRYAWERLPAPFGIRDYINDYSPCYQIFKVNLPEKEFAEWSRMLPKDTNLFVQLWQQSPDQQNRLILNERIHDPALRLVVYNMHAPDGKSAFISADGIHRGATHGLRIGNRPMHPKTYRYFGPSDHRRQAVDTLALELENRLQARYRLVVTQGRDGKKLDEYPLVIAAGRGKASVSVTGEVKGLKDGGVVLNYSIPSKKFAGMGFMGSAGGERLDAWVKKEVKESSRGAGIGGGPDFEVRSFVRMSFDEQGQCIVKDFKYTIMRAQPLDKSGFRFRHAWLTVELHFNPVKPSDIRNISGTYSSTANGDTWHQDLELFRTTEKKNYKNVQGAGTWTLTQDGDSWVLRLQPGIAPLPEMLAPIEVTMEEE